VRARICGEELRYVAVRVADPPAVLAALERSDVRALALGDTSN